MNSNEIIFSLNFQEKIIVSLKDPLTLVGWNDNEPILLLYNNNTITLANSPIYFNIKDFQNLLKKALNNELLLDKTIILDIGFIFNEYYYKASQIPTGNLQKQNPLLIEKYHLWEAHENKASYVTWIYNNHDENIIFEVTPSYPYFYCDKKKEPSYISYEKWITTYKPYFIAELSHATAQQWLDQAEYIVKTVDDNIIRWKKK